MKIVLCVQKKSCTYVRMALSNNANHSHTHKIQNAIGQTRLHYEKVMLHSVSTRRYTGGSHPCCVVLIRARCIHGALHYEGGNTYLGDFLDGLTGVWYSALLLDDPGKYISDDDATNYLLSNNR